MQDTDELAHLGEQVEEGNVAAGEEILLEQSRAEMEQVRRALDKVLGQLLPSTPEVKCRWTGELRTHESDSEYGRYIWDKGYISLEERRTYAPARWRTYLHELLHGCSLGVVTRDGKDEYDNRPGWEEGVVESLQRELRMEVMRVTSQDWDDKECKRIIWDADKENDCLSEEGEEHPYHPYVIGIWAIARELDVSVQELCLQLLQISAEQRVAYPMRLARNQPEKNIDTYAIMRFRSLLDIDVRRNLEPN